MDEIWKPIPNYDFDYAVSNTGKVASMKKGWRVLKGTRNSLGYMVVGLFDGRGGQRNVNVHRLVALAFLGPKPSSKHQVNHKNGVKTDPRAENLEWVTASQNTQHRFDVLGQKSAHGAAHSQAKLTEVEVREIRRRRAAGELGVVVATDYGIGQAQVSRIMSGERWGWLK